MCASVGGIVEGGRHAHEQIISTAGVARSVTAFW
jgi:hypothetical protein